MKLKHLLTLIITLFFISIYGQESDTIFLIKGDTLKVKITNISDNEVTYSLLQETITRTTAKTNIHKIKYKNGKTEILTVPQSSWKDITFTTNPDDVRGLTKLGEVEGIGKSLMGGENKTRPKAEKIIKMAAAEKGATVIFINSQNFSQGVQNSTIIKGIAYSGQKKEQNQNFNKNTTNSSQKTINDDNIHLNKTNWKDITFTTNPDDVRGLTKLGEVEGIGKSLMGGENKTRPKAEKIIKMAAAEKGATVIFINSQNFSQGIQNSTIIKGIAYR